MSNNFHQTQVQWQVAVRFVLNVILYMGGKRNYDFVQRCWLNNKRHCFMLAS